MRTEELRVIRENFILIGPQFTIGYQRHGQWNRVGAPIGDDIDKLRAWLAEATAALDKPIIDTIEEARRRDEAERKKMEAYGLCPHCGAYCARRERRPNGNDECVNGHVYPSSAAVFGATPKRYWISWTQPTDDYRPKEFPPPFPVLGWWCTGEAHDGHTLCAVVEGTSKQGAKRAVLDNRCWPDAGDWRILDEYPAEWWPSSDRFPLEDWMKERAR